MRSACALSSRTAGNLPAGLNPTKSALLGWCRSAVAQDSLHPPKGGSRIHQQESAPKCRIPWACRGKHPRAQGRRQKGEGRERERERKKERKERKRGKSKRKKEEEEKNKEENRRRKEKKRNEEERQEGQEQETRERNRRDRKGDDNTTDKARERRRVTCPWALEHPLWPSPLDRHPQNTLHRRNSQ